MHITCSISAGLLICLQGIVVQGVVVEGLLGAAYDCARCDGAR